MKDVKLNVKGNISNCEIQMVKINTTYKPLTFIYEETYQVINKCDNSVISEYKEGQAGFLLWIFILSVMLMILIVLLDMYQQQKKIKGR